MTLPNLAGVATKDLVEKIGAESPFAETEIVKTHDNWVSDAAGALNRDEMCAINGLCNKLQAEHGVQLGVITMSGAGKGTDRSFATEIFNEAIGRRIDTTAGFSDEVVVTSESESVSSAGSGLSVTWVLFSIGVSARIESRGPDE